MATIESSIMLMDGMSKPLNSIINSINLTISSLQKVNNTNINLNTSELLTAQAQIQSAGAQIRKIEEDINKNINSNVNSQNNFNNSLRTGVKEADNLFVKMKSFIGIFAGIQTLKMGVNISDTISQNTARLNLMNDGQQSTRELQNMIFESSKRSRGDYFATVDSIGKMGLTSGDAFSSNKELINFMELINKQFKISGTSAVGIDAAMLQLTQAMGAGVLRGEELNSIFEQAPLIIKNIASYLNVPIGQIKSMAAEGKITANIVKNAMFFASDDINKQFQSIPKTFNDITVSIKNSFLKEYEPISQRLSNLVNSNNFNTFTNTIISGVVKIIDYTVSGMDLISKIGTTIISNWNVISPLIGAVTMATIAYKSSIIMTNIALIKNNILQGKNILNAIVMAGKNTYLAASTFAYTLAQEGLNAALYACPITWIIGGLSLIVGALYLGVAAYNKFTDSSISATGIITGGIGMIVGTVLNMGITIWNTLFSVAEFFVNVWKTPIYSVQKLFSELVIGLVNKLMFLAKVSDKILGTDYNKKLTDIKTSLETNLVVNKPQEYINSNLKRDYIDVKQWGNIGYEIGTNFFRGQNIENTSMVETNKYLSDINKNVSDISNSLDLTTDEIKYMRDIAEMEVINRFTTAEIKVEVGGITNQVNNDLDFENVYTEIGEKLKESIEVAANGRYD